MMKAEMSAGDNLGRCDILVAGPCLGQFLGDLDTSHLDEPLAASPRIFWLAHVTHLSDQTAAVQIQFTTTVSNDLTQTILIQCNEDSSRFFNYTAF